MLTNQPLLVSVPLSPEKGRNKLIYISVSILMQLLHSMLKTKTLEKLVIVNVAKHVTYSTII